MKPPVRAGHLLIQCVRSEPEQKLPGPAHGVGQLLPVRDPVPPRPRLAPAAKIESRIAGEAPRRQGFVHQRTGDPCRRPRLFDCRRHAPHPLYRDAVLFLNAIVDLFPLRLDRRQQSRGHRHRCLDVRPLRTRVCLCLIRRFVDGTAYRRGAGLQDQAMSTTTFHIVRHHRALEPQPFLSSEFPQPAARLPDRTVLPDSDAAADDQLFAGPGRSHVKQSIRFGLFLIVGSRLAQPVRRG